jgi:ribosomal protein S18 acetylase RimI-like enzyme
MQARRLAPQDAELAALAVNMVKPEEERDGNDVSVEYMRRWLHNAANILIVATQGEIPIGFAAAYELDRIDRDQSMVLFYEIEVGDGHRRQGVGRALVEELKSICARDGVLKMWVETDESNIPGLRLYESAGGLRGKPGSLSFAWRKDDFASR